MKTVQMLDLGDGVAREIEFINSPSMARNQIVIELVDERPLAQICADFDDIKTIKRTDNVRPEIVTHYEGFSQLIGVNRNVSAGTVRLTLRKP